MTIPHHSYSDIPARAPPKSCLHCVRNEQNLRERPLGGAIDESGAFLNTFDCQEQPWKSSKHRVESHHELGCQDIWRPSVRYGKLTGDSLGDFAQLQPEQEWRSSRTYIPSAHDSGKPWSWRPCIRSSSDGNTRSSCENKWKPCVHVVGPPEGDSEKPHTKCIKVPTCYSTTWKETSSPPFRPSLRYIPELVPERRDWRIAKGHVCSKQCVHQLQESAYICGEALEDALETDSGMQEGIHTQKKLTPFKEHRCNSPSNCLPQDDPPLNPQIEEEGSLLNIEEESRSLVTKEEILLQRGKKFIPLPPNSGACIPRLAHTGVDLSARCTTPKEHHGKMLDDNDVGERNQLPSKGCLEGDKSCTICDHKEDVNFEPLDHEYHIQPLPHMQHEERQVYAPQGRLNEYIIDDHFHGFKQLRELQTEQRSQFQTSKPWLRKQIYDNMNQASKENKYQCWSVSPSLTSHLYEDQNAVVS